MYSRPLGQNIIYLCLKWEHLSSDLRPTAAEGPFSGLEKSNRKRTVAEHLSTLWMSGSAQAVKYVWAKQSLLISITHYDTIKIMQYSFHASCYNSFHWSKLRTFSNMQPCSSCNVLFVEPFKDFQVFRRLISSRSAWSLLWGVHKQLDSKRFIVSLRLMEGLNQVGLPLLSPQSLLLLCAWAEFHQTSTPFPRACTWQCGAKSPPRTKPLAQQNGWKAC